MSDINTVLERLITDPGFRQQIKEDPSTALKGYNLTPADLELLAAQVSDDVGTGDSSVETRTSKSALAGLLGLFGGSSQQSHGETDYEFVGRLAESDDSADKLGNFEIQTATSDMNDNADPTPDAFDTAGDDPEGGPFAKVDHIDGESKDSAASGKDHDKWVDIQSVSPPLHEPGGGATGGDGDVDGADFLVWQDNLGDDSDGTPTNEIAMEGAPDNSEDLPLSGEGENGEEMITGYLEVPDIAGESQHADAGPVLEDVVVTKEVDASSQKPHEAAVAGADDLQVSGQDGEDEYVKVKLENAQITSYQLGVLDNDAIPGDTVDDLGSPDAPGSEAKKIIDSPNLMKWDNTTTEAPRQHDLAESVPDDEFPDQVVVTPIDEGGDGPVGDLTAEPEAPQEAKRISSSVGHTGKNRPAVGVDQTETIGSDKSTAVGSTGDPDQPIVMGTVPNAEDEGGIGSDGDLVQGAPQAASEVETEMVQLNLTSAEPIGPLSEGDGLAVDGLVGPKTEGGEPDLHTGDYMDDDLPPS